MLLEYKDFIYNISCSFYKNFSSGSIYDLDDYYQEACIAFLRAIDTYDFDKAKASLKTYASKVIRNHLTDVCRHVNKIKNPREISLNGMFDSNNRDEKCVDRVKIDQLTQFDCENKVIDAEMTSKIIDFMRELYIRSNKTMRRGLYCIDQMSQGYTIKEAADSIGVESNNMRACVNVARKRLKILLNGENCVA